jgi:hypothetical protein
MERMVAQKSRFAEMICSYHCFFHDEKAEEENNGYVVIKFTSTSQVENRTKFGEGRGLVFFLLMYDIQHCFICRPSDSTVSEDTGIETRTVATTTALAVRRSNHWAIDLIHSRIDFIHTPPASLLYTF